jgi:hypothetical protein
MSAFSATYELQLELSVFTSSHLNRITNSSVFVCSVCKISENSEESSSASFLCNHNNNVTENTVQLNTHSSTAEKSTVRLKEDLISNDIKEEPFDYEFIETQEVKHRKIAY